MKQNVPASKPKDFRFLDSKSMTLGVSDQRYCDRFCYLGAGQWPNKNRIPLSFRNPASQRKVATFANRMPVFSRKALSTGCLQPLARSRPKKYNASVACRARNGIYLANPGLRALRKEQERVS